MARQEDTYPFLRSAFECELESQHIQIANNEVYENKRPLRISQFQEQRQAVIKRFVANRTIDTKSVTMAGTGTASVLHQLSAGTDDGARILYEGALFCFPSGLPPWKTRCYNLRPEELIHELSNLDSPFLTWNTMCMLLASLGPCGDPECAKPCDSYHSCRNTNHHAQCPRHFWCCGLTSAGHPQVLFAMEYNRLDPRTIFSWAPFDLGLSLDFLEPELSFLISGNANLAPEEVALRIEMTENLIEFLRADPPTSIWDDEVPYDHNEMDAESNLEVRHPYHHLLMSLASAQKRLTHSSALLDQPWANRFKDGDFQPWDNIYFLFLYLNGADVVRPLAQADKIRMQLRCRIRPSISKVPAKILELLTSFQTALILGPYTTAVPCPCDKVSKQGRGRFCDHMQQHMRKHRPYVMEMYNDVWSKPVDSQTNGYFTFAECKLLQEAGVGVQPPPKHLFTKEQDPIGAKATKIGKCKKSKSKGCNSRKRKFSQSQAAPLAAQSAGDVVSQNQTSFQSPMSEKPNKRARKRLRDISLAKDNRRAEVHDIQTPRSQQDIVCALQQPASAGKTGKTLTELAANGKSTFPSNNHRKRETKRARKKARSSVVCSNLAKASPEEVAAAIAVTKARRALGEATVAALAARKAALLGIEHAKNARYQESAADILARRDVRSAEEYEKSVKQQNADAEKNLAEAKKIFQAAVAEEIRVKEAVLERSRAEKEAQLQNDAIPGPTQTQKGTGGGMAELDMNALEHDGAQYNPKKHYAGKGSPGEEAHTEHSPESLAKVEVRVGKPSPTQASDGEIKHGDSYSHDMKSPQSRESSMVLHPPKSLSILSECSSPLLRPRFMDIDIPLSTSLVTPASSAGTMLTNIEPKKPLQMSVECLEATPKGSRYSTPLFAQNSIQKHGHRFSVESITRSECGNIQKSLDAEHKESAVSTNSVTAIFDLSSPASNLDVPVFGNFHGSGDRKSHVPQDLRNRQVLQPYEQKPAIPLIQGSLDSPMYSLCPPTHLDVTTIHPPPHQLQHQFNQYMVQMSRTSIGRPKSAFCHPLIQGSGPLPRSHHDKMMSEKMPKSPDRPSLINETPVPSPRSTDVQAFTNRFLLDHRSQSATVQSNVVHQTSNGTLQEYGPKALCFQQSIVQDAHPLRDVFLPHHKVQHPGFQPTEMDGLTNGAMLVHSHGSQPLMQPASMERAKMSVQPASNESAPFFSRHRASSQSAMAVSTTPCTKEALLDSHRQRLSPNESPVPVPVHRNIFPKPGRSEIQSLSGSPRLPVLHSSVLDANISATDADSAPSITSRDSQTSLDCRIPDEKALGMEHTPPRDMRADSCITSKEVLTSNSTSDKNSPSHFDFGLETSPSPKVSRRRFTDSSNDEPTTKRGRKSSYDSFYDISDDGRVDFSFLDAPELPQESMDSVENGENERYTRFFNQTPIPEAPRFNRESSIIMPSIEEQDVLEERSLWPTKGKFDDGARKPNAASKDFNMQDNHGPPPCSTSMAITNEMAPPPPHSKASHTSMAPAMIPRQRPMTQSFEPQDIEMPPPVTPRKTHHILPGETSPTTIAAVRRSPRRPAVFTPINGPSKATDKSIAGSFKSQIPATTSRLPMNTRTAKKKGSPKKRGRQAQTPMRIFSEWERASSEMPELMRPLMDSAKSFARDLSEFVKDSPESTKKIGAELRVITKHLSKTKKIVKGAI